jgi:oxygen-independent coproporphyrinogen-3 oxidase
MENVGYSTEGKECIYNIQMIEERQTIIALGADGVSKIVFRDENRIERVPNVKDVIEYNKRVEEMVRRKVHALEELYK